MAYALDLCNTFIQLQKALVGSVHIFAWNREQTRFASAFRAKFLILSLHSVHVRGRSTDVRYVSREARKAVQSRDFLDYGFFASRLYELALMRSYGTEITSSETAAMGIDRKFDHLEGRYMLALVARMRQLSERKVPE